MGSFNIIISHTVEEEPLVKTDNVTRGMIRQRAVELAVMNGRPAQETSKSDWEAAKLEHNGKTQRPKCMGPRIESK